MGAARVRSGDRRALGSNRLSSRAASTAYARAARASRATIAARYWRCNIEVAERISAHAAALAGTRAAAACSVRRATIVERVGRVRTRRGQRCSNAQRKCGNTEGNTRGSFRGPAGVAGRKFGRSLDHAEGTIEDQAIDVIHDLPSSINK